MQSSPSSLVILRRAELSNADSAPSFNKMSEIFKRVAASVPHGLADSLEDLLVVKPDGNTSGLQAIKANPSKPSVDAMLTLLDKLKVIEATGVL